MKPLFLALFLFSALAHAQVISPSSVEVKFDYETEFQTAKDGTAKSVVLEQAKYMFAYMQNPQIAAMFGLPKSFEGVAAPRWEPSVRVLSDSKAGGLRTIRYEMSGLLLVNKKVAAQLLPQGHWDIALPYDLDHYYDENCVDPEDAAPVEFWYFGQPLKPGCEHLLKAPLASTVSMRLSPAPAVPDRAVGLADLRSHDVFQIASINGFDDNSTKKNDDGRVNFMAMNAWFRSQGFKMTIDQHYKTHPVYVFEKELTRADGTTFTARIVRLLADTGLDGSRKVTFAKFITEAFLDSDVVIYEGHSGMGVNLDLDTLNQQLLISRDPRAPNHVEFDRAKHQLFLFDACSSYSYYLGMFDGLKDPGTLAVMSNGLESLFGYELPMTKHLYTELLDLNHAKVANDGLTWEQLLEEYERPLRGNTFMLNVDIND